jgi:hypothetical protein
VLRERDGSISDLVTFIPFGIDSTEVDFVSDGTVTVRPGLVVEVGVTPDHPLSDNAAFLDESTTTDFTLYTPLLEGLTVGIPSTISYRIFSDPSLAVEPSEFFLVRGTRCRCRSRRRWPSS